MVENLKWSALIVFSLVVAFVVGLAAYGGYEVEVNAKEFFIKVRPTGKTTDSVEFGEPKLAEVVEQHLAKVKLVNAKRKATYTIKAIEKDVVIMDAQHELELKNSSDSTVQEDLDVRLPEHYPEPEVIIDGLVVNPLQVTSTSPHEVVRLYRIMILGRETKAVSYKLRDLRRRLPHNAPDVVTRPTLHSEVIIEGPPNLMKKLRVDVVGLTWRDNWEMSKPHTPNRITYGWRTRYPLLPYQGANIHLSAEQQ